MQKKTFKYFLQGRLGNQIWGLSDAYRLHKIVNEKIHVFVLQESAIKTSPLFIDFIKAQEWLVMNCLQKGEIEELRSAIGADDGMRKHVKNGFRNFRGFSPSYRLLLESGLFKEGLFPFSSPSLKSTEPFVSIGVRREDYWYNPHLGILPKNYYRLALRKLESDLMDLDLRIFGALDLSQARKAIPRKLRNKAIYHPRTSDPVNDLEIMSMATYSIIANSTFSYLGAFFSTSKRIFMPEPFYLKIAGWEENLNSPRTENVKILMNKNRRYLFLRTAKKMYILRSKIGKKFH